jgi:hypothetical protein
MKTKSFAFAVLLFGGAAIAQADTFVVNSTADDGSANTLRWAIVQNNARPGGNTIQIVPSASPFRIKLNSLLPPIIGPATVTAASDEVAAIDNGAFAMATINHRARVRPVVLDLTSDHCKSRAWLSSIAETSKFPTSSSPTSATGCVMNRIVMDVIVLAAEQQHSDAQPGIRQLIS